MCKHLVTRCSACMQNHDLVFRTHKCRLVASLSLMDLVSEADPWKIRKRVWEIGWGGSVRSIHSAKYTSTLVYLQDPPSDFSEGLVPRNDTRDRCCGESC